MDFVISVIHPVKDLTKAVLFLCDTLGFSVKQQSDTAVTVDNGAVAIRLVSTQDPEGVVYLELQTQNLPKTEQELLLHPEISSITPLTAMGLARIESQLQGPQGIIITLAQVFNEDEIGVIPPLPTSLIWDDNAEICIKQMLRFIPVDFRGSARLRITECAEMLAAEQGHITVNITNAVQALADVTPNFQHQTLISALLESGISNAANYFKKTSL